jgi:hypothetical protein
MALLRHRRDEAEPSPDRDRPASPSSEELIRSLVITYVQGEGHYDETIFALARRFSPTPDSDLVERAIRDLVRERRLTIDGGKVVPRPARRTPKASFRD